MNISLFASIGCQNLWDELILKNEIQLLQERFGENTQFRVFSYDPQNPFFLQPNISYLEYFPVGIKNPWNILRNLRNYSSFLGTLLWSDVVVIGGGGLFYEHEVQSTRSPLDLWGYRTFWIRFLRKKLLFFAVGIDVDSEKWLEKIKKIFSYKKAEITVRDTQSFFTLRSVWLSAELVDDPVFSEKQVRDTGRVLGVFDSQNFTLKHIQRLHFTWKKVGVALRQWYIGKFKNQKLEILMIEEILTVIEEKGGTIVLLPHSFHEVDEKANDLVFLGKFAKPSRTIKTTMREVYDTYLHQEIDVCIAMRLHSIILSYVHGVDIVALSYSKKTDEVLKKLSR